MLTAKNKNRRIKYRNNKEYREQRIEYAKEYNNKAQGITLERIILSKKVYYIREKYKKALELKDEWQKRADKLEIELADLSFALVKVKEKVKEKVKGEIKKWKKREYSNQERRQPKNQDLN